MIIYKQYTAEQLDEQYNNRLHIPDFVTYFERWDKRSADTRNKHTCLQNLKYGDHARDCLDVFTGKGISPKVLVFIHGGYWQMFDKQRFHFIAEAFLAYDITTVFVNYPLAPIATLDEMVESCKKSMVWLQHHLPGFNSDPQQVYVAGHSAGAQLATMLAEEHWLKTMPNPIKGICAISGLFDLQPIRLSFVNNALKMSDEMAARNSPIHLMPAKNCPVLVATGTAETMEFKAQGSTFYTNWKNKAATIELIELPGLNHFSILDALADKNTLLFKSLLKLMEE